MSVIISLALNFCFNEIYSFYLKLNAEQTNIEENITQEVVKREEIKAKEYKDTEDTNLENIWQIEIPKIGLVAPIAKGTDQDVLLEYVGHFENTEYFEGNVGLAAHNRGFPINYFSRIKELKVNDKIIYTTKYGKKTYIVKTIKIIKDTDWSYLKETKDNRITLITCVENQPSKRLCVQGIELKEE